MEETIVWRSEIHEKISGWVLRRWKSLGNNLKISWGISPKGKGFMEESQENDMQDLLKDLLGTFMKKNEEISEGFS